MPRAVFSAKLIQMQPLRKRRKRSFAVRIEISQFDQPGWIPFESAGAPAHYRRWSVTGMS
jgi:hypothetical protein